MSEQNKCKESDYKLCFTLKQHTPIIHFQHNQKGATLRATELKPKLDRFLIEKLGLHNDKGKPKGEFKSWFIAGQDGALDYKVRVEPNVTQIFPIEYHKKKWDRDAKKNVPHFDKDNNKVTTTLPTFFANMGDEWKQNPKQLIISDELNVTIQCFNSSLLAKIKEFSQEFIFVTTFGMRQSKGFGSFTLTQIDKKDIKQKEYGYCKFNVDLTASFNKHKKELDKKYVEIPNDKFIEFFELFETIHRFHQTLRSGINEKLYFKPWIFYYAMNRNIQWDKKTLKQNFLGDQCLSEQIEKHNPAQDEPLSYSNESNNSRWLVRDLLGLSTEQVWRAKPKNSQDCDYGFTVRHPKEKNGKGIDRFDNKIISPNEVKRFKSPITYKPVKTADKKYTIYIILNSIPQELFGEKFTIVKDKKGIKNILKDMQMWDEFDLENFFKDIIDNKDNLVDKFKNSDKNNLLYKKITNIYESLERIEDATN